MNQQAKQGQTGSVLATSSILADIAQNIAGNRLLVEALIPIGMDPHTFDPTPQDITRLAKARLLIINGGGLEHGLEEIITNSGGDFTVVEASRGLVMRIWASVVSTGGNGTGTNQDQPEEHDTGDPHFWLDPISVISYVENIRDGLIQEDPTGEETYRLNADAYIQKLQELDRWIRNEVEQIPYEKRLLVTNHESFGYYADRYGFRIIGTLIRSASSGSTPTASELAELVEIIRDNSAPAIFLETGSNPELALQIGQETGAKVVTDLYSHSLSEHGGPAPDYLQMMRYNTQLITNALSQEQITLHE